MTLCSIKNYIYVIIAKQVPFSFSVNCTISLIVSGDAQLIKKTSKSFILGPWFEGKKQKHYWSSLIFLSEESYDTEIKFASIYYLCNFPNKVNM